MIVGATGTLAGLEPADETWVKIQIRSWLARLNPELGYVDLQPGTGFLFAETLLAAHIPYRVLLSALDGADSARDLPRRQHLLRHAAAILPVLEENAADAVRNFLISHCDLLFVLLPEEVSRPPTTPLSAQRGLMAALLLFPSLRITQLIEPAPGVLQHLFETLEKYPTMISSTHSTLHRRFKKFVEWIAPDEAQREKLETQGVEVRDRVKAKAEAAGLQIDKIRYSGSYAKHTGLRRYMHGTPKDEGIEGLDMDIAFILKPKDTSGNTLGCQIPAFEGFLEESYPKSATGHTQSSAKISFVASKQRFDIVPLFTTDKADVQKLIRLNGDERQSSVVKHVDFIHTRNSKSDEVEGVVKFNQCLRLVKWWRYVQQMDSGVFGNGEDDDKVPSFLLDLLCAKAFDEKGVEKTYADTLAKWFSYLAHIVGERKLVDFTDYSTDAPAVGSAIWYVADPVDKTNNVVKSWNKTKVDELGDWFKRARTKINEAVQKDGEEDHSASMEAMVALMGNAFKNQTKDIV